MPFWNIHWIYNHKKEGINYEDKIIGFKIIISDFSLQNTELYGDSIVMT